MKSLTENIETLAPNLILNRIQIRASDKFFQMAFESGWLDLQDMWAITSTSFCGESRAVTLYREPDEQRAEYLSRSGMSIDYILEHGWEVARIQATADLEKGARPRIMPNDGWRVMQRWFQMRELNSLSA